MLVEAITYRFRGHSMADPEEYRTKEQVAEWRKRDPIEVFARQARGRGHARARARPRRWTRRSSSASTRPSRSPTSPTFPPPESLYDHIYVLGDQVKGWYSVDERSAGVHRGEDERELAEAERGPDRRLRRRRSSRPSREDLGLEKASDQAQAEDDDAEEAEKD